MAQEKITWNTSDQKMWFSITEEFGQTIRVLPSFLREILPIKVTHLVSNQAKWGCVKGPREVWGLTRPCWPEFGWIPCSASTNYQKTSWGFGLRKGEEEYAWQEEEGGKVRGVWEVWERHVVTVSNFKGDKKLKQLFWPLLKLSLDITKNILRAGLKAFLWNQTWFFSSNF